MGQEVISKRKGRIVSARSLLLRRKVKVSPWIISSSYHRASAVRFFTEADGKIPD